MQAFDPPDPQQLCSIKTSTLHHDSVTDFDIYIDIGGQMVLYAPQPYRWTYEEIQRLENGGHQELYYGSQDQQLVRVYEKLTKLSHELPQDPAERLNKIMELAATFTKVLHEEHQITHSSLSTGQKIADELIQNITAQPDVIKHLNTLSHHHDYTFHHSGRVAAHSIAISIQLGMNSPEQLEAITLGCLLHDIGKAMISLEILDKPGPLTPEEWTKVKKHPRHGYQMVKDHHLPPISQQIILHHHERPDGGGYPDGLLVEDLLPEVRIAAFADIYDALTSWRPYQQARTRYEALDFIRHHLLDHIWPDAFKALVALLNEPEQKTGA